MDKTFFKNNAFCIIYNLLILLIFIIGYGHFGDAIVDSFREAYIPEQVSKGEVLYKNIFSIYAPFAYLFNGFLFKIFGSNLKVLYAVGFILSLGILNLVYIISNLFLEKKYSFSIILFMISGAVLSPNVFNYFFPYSYGILYGLFFILLCLYFCFKDRSALAFIFYTLAVCSKYEFALLLPLLIFASYKKNLFKNLMYSVLTALLIVSPLFIQSVGVENIVASIQIIIAMTAAKTLYWFYSILGLTFRWELIPIYLINFFKCMIPMFFLYRFYSIFTLFLTIVYFYFFATPEILIFIFPLILISFIIRYKNLTHEEVFFILSALLISAKIFFAFTMQSYGVFFIPFCLISLYILIPKFLRKAFCIVLISIALSFGIKNINSLLSRTVKIQTTKGTFYTTTAYGKSISKIVDYVQKNTNNEDKILVYPECLIVNYMSDRSSDNKFYSLIPLYVETFGEDIIIKRIAKIRPKYILINNYNTSNYYYSYFGQDYAGEILHYISEHYKKIAVIGENLIFTVYEYKD